MALKSELREAWDAANEGARKASLDLGELSQISEAVVGLRRSYAGLRSGQSPDFRSSATQVAYAVAYHPLHVYSYLSMLAEWGLGEEIFGSLPRVPRILSLGSGPAAEISAIARWLRLQNASFYSPIEVELVDQANWTSVRNHLTDPVVKDYHQSGLMSFSVFKMDLMTASAVKFLRNRVGQVDIVLLPSSVTEFSRGSDFNVFVSALRELVEAGAKLVLIDHDIPGFRSLIKPMMDGFEQSFCEIPKGKIYAPRPSVFLRDHFFDPQLGQSPSRTYKMAWFAVSNGDSYRSDPDTSVLSLVQDSFGVTVEPGEPEFVNPGWFREGMITGIECDECGGNLRSYRKRFALDCDNECAWVIVCTICREANDVAVYEESAQRHFRDWSKNG